MIFFKINHHLIVILIVLLGSLLETRSEIIDKNHKLKSLVKTYLDYTEALNSDSIVLNYLLKQQLVKRIQQLDLAIKNYMKKSPKNVITMRKVWSELHKEKNVKIKQKQHKATTKKIKSASGVE